MLYEGKTLREKKIHKNLPVNMRGTKERAVNFLFSRGSGDVNEELSAGSSRYWSRQDVDDKVVKIMIDRCTSHSNYDTQIFRPENCLIVLSIFLASTGILFLFSAPCLLPPC